MPELDDNALLQEYAAKRSETAIEALVQRHVNLVYSAALRQVRDPHRAAEITQTTFVILARRVGSLRSGTILAGWLLRTARFAALAERRSAARRQRYETEAQMDAEHQREADHNPAWEQIAPHLDEALAELRETDRAALVLRYFKDKPLAEVGQALGVAPDAAQKRVERAVEKLRRCLLKRGMAYPILTLIALISANAVQAAPAVLAASVASKATIAGTITTTSSAALVKGTLKLMAWTKAKTTGAVALGVLFVAGTATVTLTRIEGHGDRTRAQVFEILGSNTWNFLSDNRELEMLLAMGPKALPALSELVDWHETSLHRMYVRIWPWLPNSLRQHRLEDPRRIQELHRKAVQAVYELGPAAIRPLTSGMCRAAEEHPEERRNYALDSLYWSIPESELAARTLIRCLSNPARGGLFSHTDGWDIYPQVPGALPLLIPCLENSALTREAAIGLGKFGRQATNAVPALLEVCESGFVNLRLKPRPKVSYASKDELLLLNRCAAFEAVGKIAIVSSDVLAVIRRGLTDPQEDIRFAAIAALTALHQTSLEDLTNTLSSFTARRSIKFLKIMEWVGMQESDGISALAWLRQFADADLVQRLPEGIKATTGDFTIDANYFRLTAILAICRIQPDVTRQYLPDFLAEFDRRWEPVEWLSESKSLAAEITTALEPRLMETNSLRAARAAYVILALNPEHAPSLAALRGGLGRGTLNERVITARWLWQRLGETNGVLPLLIEGLAAPESHIGQNAANTLSDLGPQARAAIPALKAALWHKDRYVRENAGKALRKVAPDEMPFLK